MGNISEVRKLSLHPLAIHTFIKAQAGSLGKALSEAVMNSIDAFATQVHVTLDGNGFTIEDNGQGFRDKSEIGAWFETLGFPHDDGNHRLYGKFGMGRAQMWAFAKTKWTSNQFVMKVDVQNKGLDYELEYADEPFKGTRIEADFYEEMPFARQQQTEIELQQLVLYVPGAVFINGKLASKDPACEKWDLETPEAYFKFQFDKKQHTLDVYNAGLLVSHFPEYRYGCTGVVVTKPEAALSLNLARNEILEKECKVWAKVSKLFPKKDNKTAKPKADKMKPVQMRDLGRQVKAGTIKLDDALSRSPHLLVSVLGRPLELGDVASYHSERPVVFVPKGDEFGKRLQKLRLAVAVSRESLENFGLTEPAEFKALVRKHMGAKLAPYRYGQTLEKFDKTVWTLDAPGVFPLLAAGKKQFAISELAPAEKAAAHAWGRARIALANQLREVCSEPQLGKLREVNTLNLGDCPLGEPAWVDCGAHAWVLNRAQVTAVMSRPLPVVTKFAMNAMRPLCDHIAGDEAAGKELLLKLLSDTEALGVFILNLTRFHINECRKQDVTVEPTRLSDLDALHTM